MSKNYPWYQYYPDQVVNTYYRLKWKWEHRNDPKPYVGEVRCIHDDHHATIVEILHDDLVVFDTGERQDWYHCTSSLDDCEHKGQVQ